MATNTYVALQTQVLGSAAASVTLSPIPSGYTDLLIVVASSNSTNTDTYIRFNGDSSSAYSSTYIRGDGSSAYSGRRSSFNRILIEENGTGTGQMVTKIAVQNYSNSTTYKTILSRADAASNGTSAVVGLWSNTAAITSILIGSDSGNFQTGSTFTIYGLLASN